MDDKELKNITEIIGLKNETTKSINNIAEKLVETLLKEEENEN